jgi:hypothetical protein
MLRDGRARARRPAPRPRARLSRRPPYRAPATLAGAWPPIARGRPTPARGDARSVASATRAAAARRRSAHAARARYHTPFPVPARCGRFAGPAQWDAAGEGPNPAPSVARARRSPGGPALRLGTPPGPLPRPA